MILPPYRYGQKSETQDKRVSMAVSWSGLKWGSFSWSRVLSLSSSVSWPEYSQAGHGPEGGHPLSPLDYLGGCTPARIA